MIENNFKGTMKEELVEWMSLGLKKALTLAKIMKGFTTIGIWPLQPSTMYAYMKPNSYYTTI